MNYSDILLEMDQLEKFTTTFNSFEEFNENITETNMEYSNILEEINELEYLEIPENDNVYYENEPFLLNVDENINTNNDTHNNNNNNNNNDYDNNNDIDIDIDIGTINCNDVFCETDECCICLESKKLWRTTCNHIICRICLPHLQYPVSCPMCRKDIESEII